MDTILKIVIPYSDTDEYRRTVLGYVTSLYNEHGFDVIIGEIPSSEPWSKGRAIRTGIAGMSDDEVIGVADADVWLPPEGPVTAWEQGRWVIPHYRVRRLSQGATAALMEDRDEWLQGGLDRAPYVGIPGGGIVILTVGQYRQCPIDPRFEGWGSEDHAWGYALYAMFGNPIRGTMDLIHFWHPPDPQKGYGKLGSNSNSNLRKKYFQAIHKPDVLRSLINEGERLYL